VTLSIINKREEGLKIAKESKKRNIKFAVIVKFYQLILDVLPNDYLEVTVQIILARFER